MTWYLDASAFVKLGRQEPDSDAVRRWTRHHAYVSSDLLRTEARRAAAADATAAAQIDELLQLATLIRLTPEIFDEAGNVLSATRLRSLDAIHIAAARRLGPDLDGIVTYDRRMTEAAQSLGIAVAAPA